MPRKDYFQDIVPPEGQGPPQPHYPEPDTPERGIRNINIAPRPPRMNNEPPPAMRPPRALPPPRRRGRFLLWILTIVSVLVVAGLALLFFFSKTTVTVVPQSQAVVFDNTTPFTAFPAQGAASGTIAFTVQSTDIADSAVVQGSGTEHAESKASGSITVVNDYSTSPVRLVKNTRFQTAAGLIFRVPADVSIPGKQGTAPGKVSVTVVADSAGDQYNIGPTDRFTLPGLQSTPAMYTGVYAYSSASTTGGFSGERTAVTPGDRQSAVANLRSGLASKASAYAATLNSGTAMPLSPQVTYTDLPDTAATNGGVQINESARVDVPLVPSDAFASSVGQTVAAGATQGSVKLVPGPDFAIHYQSTSTPDLTTNPLSFTIAGKGTLVWVVDTNALAQALAGRDGAAFEAIVANFPGVQSAHARIEPFWNSSFPKDPSAIQISVQDPTKQGQ